MLVQPVHSLRTVKSRRLINEGDVCPQCGATLVFTKGVEVGNIFDLGERFSAPFKFKLQLEDGTTANIIMGCYGIGTTRLVGSIVEAMHDDAGIIWPKSVAPFAVHLVTVQSRTPENTVMEESLALYESLTKAGIEVLWDDRDVSTGAKFADADLIGIPLRLVVSEKTLADNVVEWKERSGTEATRVPLADVIEAVKTWKNT